MLPLDPFSDMSGPVMAQSTVFVRNLVDLFISRPSRNTAHGDNFEVLHILAHAYENGGLDEEFASNVDEFGSNFDQILIELRSNFKKCPTKLGFTFDSECRSKL